MLIKTSGTTTTIDKGSIIVQQPIRIQLLRPYRVRAVNRLTTIVDADQDGCVGLHLWLRLSKQTLSIQVHASQLVFHFITLISNQANDPNTSTSLDLLRPVSPDYQAIGRSSNPASSNRRPLTQPQPMNHSAFKPNSIMFHELIMLVAAVASVV